jgi:hypothetical protein
MSNNFHWHTQFVERRRTFQRVSFGPGFVLNLVWPLWIRPLSNMRTAYLSRPLNLPDQSHPAVFELIREIAPSLNDAEYIMSLALREFSRHHLQWQGEAPKLADHFRLAIKTCCRYLRNNPPPALKTYPAWPLLLGAMIERSCAGSDEKYGVSSTELAGLLRAEFGHNSTIAAG